MSKTERPRSNLTAEMELAYQNDPLSQFSCDFKPEAFFRLGQKFAKSSNGGPLGFWPFLAKMTKIAFSPFLDFLHHS